MKNISRFIILLMTILLIFSTLTCCSIAKDDSNYVESKLVGNMKEYRSGFTTTILDDGRVLICGGVVKKISKDCEFYLPDKEKFIYGPKLNYSRTNYNSIKLQDGRVLILGDLPREGSIRIKPKKSISEIYDPKTNSMNLINFFTYYPPNISLLNDGRVLLYGFTKNSILLFDPKTEKVEELGKLLIDKFHHGPVLIDDEEILAIGGYSYLGAVWMKDGKIVGFPKGLTQEEWTNQGYKVSSDINNRQEVESFNIKTGKSKIIFEMPYSIQDHQSILLNDGRILILPGSVIKKNPSGVYSLEVLRKGYGKEISIFNPKTNEFKTLPNLGDYQMEWNNQNSGILLDDGRVFFIAFSDKGRGKYNYKYYGFIFDPKTESYKKVTNLKLATNANPIKLKDGNILLMGGYGPWYKYTKKAELIMLNKGDK